MLLGYLTDILKLSHVVAFLFVPKERPGTFIVKSLQPQVPFLEMFSHQWELI
jgi:hypothetical protein